MCWAAFANRKSLNHLRRPFENHGTSSSTAVAGFTLGSDVLPQSLGEVIRSKYRNTGSCYYKMIQSTSLV
jgi:hypothetical protein